MPLLIRVNETIAIIMIETDHNQRKRRIFLEILLSSNKDRFHPIYKMEVNNYSPLMNNNDVFAIERELPTIWEKYN